MRRYELKRKRGPNSLFLHQRYGNFGHCPASYQISDAQDRANVRRIRYGASALAILYYLNISMKKNRN